MKILSTYKVKIKTYNHIFRGTVEVYRHAVDFLIDVCLKEWVEIKKDRSVTISSAVCGTAMPFYEEASGNGL